ncbi:hypothetical protein B0H14DRAFT_3484003 [Mycena olivaceomarginata]|nr:hypothetical protein B0H14DRAFT_3484003 [Mycena olivaceomarginata]
MSVQWGEPAPRPVALRPSHISSGAKTRRTCNVTSSPPSSFQGCATPPGARPPASVLLAAHPPLLAGRLRTPHPSRSTTPISKGRITVSPEFGTDSFFVERGVDAEHEHA